MSKNVMSVKGVLVDFDLLSIKSQISESPKTDDVILRERFIDKKRRRGGRKVNELLSEQAENRKKAENAITEQRRLKSAEGSIEVKKEQPEPDHSVETPDVIHDSGKIQRKLK